MAAFKITRKDGRSNRQVISDLIKDMAPGTVLTDKQICDALSEGSNHKYTYKQGQQAICQAYGKVLKDQSRALHRVRNVGYRVAPAAYHMTLANDRQTRADRQMKRGLQTLQNVRWDEMDQNQRKAHEGQLMISSALYQAMRSLERRQSNIEDIIKKRGKDPDQ